MHSIIKKVYAHPRRGACAVKPPCGSLRLREAETSQSQLTVTRKLQRG